MRDYSEIKYKTDILFEEVIIIIDGVMIIVIHNV